MRLRDKVALVTGASTGIGRALAIGLAREGADVVVHYNTGRQGAEDTAAEIRALGRQALVAGADISSVAEVEALFRRIRAELPRLDVLVNNAAVTGWGELFEMTEERFDQVVGTNLKGTFFCSVQAARMMRDGDGGSIVNISTNCAELGVKHLAVYAASKGGVHALTKQLAVELAPYRIRVNTFAPGPTLVERNLRDDPNYDRTWGSVVPMNRAAEPEEMIGPTLFLASDESSYMTGQIFYVDGGWTVCGRLPEGYFDQAAQKNA